MHYHFGYPFNPARAELPTAPQNLRVTASDDTNITLEWDASTQGDFPISNYKLIADDIVIATPVGTSFIWDSVPANESVDYRVQAIDSDGNAGPWSDTLTYTNVVATNDAPIYLMTEPLVNDGSFDYLFNSASSGSKWDAKLLTSTDTAWNPDSAQYPQDGTIDFSGGNKADTQWIAPQDEEWTMSGVYNVVSGVSYDMYSIHYKGNQTCDIYLGSNTEDLTLSESDKDYTPPTGTWIIEEEPPAIIEPPVSEVTTEWFYIDIAYNASAPPMPNGEHINVGGDTVEIISDKSGDDSLGYTFSSPNTSTGSGFGVQNDDTGFLTDHQFYFGAYYQDTVLTMTFSGLDDAGTYEVRISGSRAASSSGNTLVTFGGQAEQEYNHWDNYSEGATFTGLTTDGSGNLVGTLYGDAGDQCMCSGLDFRRIS